MNDSETTRLLERLAETFPDRPAPLPSLIRAAREGRRRRTRRNVALLVAATAVVVGGLVVAQQGVAGDADRRSQDVASDLSSNECQRARESASPTSVPQGPDYPVNANGQSYGAHSDDDMPDLIAVIGDCGRTGYAYATDLDDPVPWEPGAGNGTPRTIDVFESDGETRIDTFTTGAGTAPTQTAPNPEGPSADAVQGRWSAIISGVSYPDGAQQYDTYRDLDLTATFDGDRLRLWDGCQFWRAGFTLNGGDFALTDGFVAESSAPAGCDRVAPIVGVVENVRHVTRARERVYLHLGTFQIVVVLTPSEP